MCAQLKFYVLLRIVQAKRLTLLQLPRPEAKLIDFLLFRKGLGFEVDSAKFFLRVILKVSHLIAFMCHTVSGLKGQLFTYDTSSITRCICITSGNTM